MAIVEAEEHMRKYFANPEPHCQNFKRKHRKYKFLN